MGGFRTSTRMPWKSVFLVASFLVIQRNDATPEPIFGGLLGNGKSGLVKNLANQVRSMIPVEVNRVQQDMEVIVEETLEKELPRGELDPARRPYEGTYCYEDDAECGPSLWAPYGPCQNGTKQSPIDIDTSTVQHYNASGYTSPHPIVFSYPEQPLPLYISHNGHSVVAQVSRDGTSNATMQVDNNEVYKFSHMHFHWGRANNNGSEHTIDGEGFAMEIHLVHYLALYDNLEVALSSGKDGHVAVVAIFVKVGRFKNVVYEDLINIYHTNRVITPGLMRTHKSIRLSKIVPTSESFFRYKGSLTVPNCAEKVAWIIFKDPIYIDKKQMEIFRRIKAGPLKDIGGKPITTKEGIEAMPTIANVRSTRRINGRPVYFYDYDKDN